MGASSAKIANAFWESRVSGLIILAADWQNRQAEPPLYFGPDKASFASLEQLSPEACGRYFRYYRGKHVWVFTLRSDRYPQLLDRSAKVYLAGDFNGWGEAIGDSRWELKPLEDKAETVFELRVGLNRIPAGAKAAFKFVTDGGDWLDVPDSAPNRLEHDGVANFCFDPEQSGRHVFRFALNEDDEPTGVEKIVWEDASGTEVHELPHTHFLTEAKTDLPLGAMVDEGEGATVFRLFAPRARSVEVRYSRGLNDEPVHLQSLTCVDKVTWEVRIPENLEGYVYSFRVDGAKAEGTTHFDPSFDILDPYAKACVGHRGPGIVAAADRFPRVVNRFNPPAWHDLVILEAHVRDLAAHAPIELSAEERRGFTGLRKWAQAEGSYLREIGVNAVELQPIQEMDNPQREDYHWGYMTVNYFSPESSYALDPEKGSQIEEFRDLVETLHDEGLAVILDVVYNHVGEPNHLLFIDKFYYFHLDQANDLVNWSGCGNDLRCDAPMSRRLIIDSLKHLVETYDVDGFRFDLAELIGPEVLREIEHELKQIKPTIVLIAEPWSFRGHIQEELRETGFASWNDGYRDGIADFVCGHGSQDSLRHFLAGSPGTTRFAAQTINYTESHDDHCWLDRITERSDFNGWDPTLLDRRRTHLMASVLFASLGVPMLAAGQDFLRSKKGISNTYQRGDINALDYNRRLFYAGTHGYFREWIRLRLSPLGKAFRFDGAPGERYLRFYFAEGSSAGVVLFNADRSVDTPQLVYAINPHLEYANISCAELQPHRLRQLVDHERFNLDGLGSACIPADEKHLFLPPLSCGLWALEAPLHFGAQGAGKQ